MPRKPAKLNGEKMNRKLFFILAALAVPTSAHAQSIEPIFNETLSGDMIVTGNAIGLSFEKGQNCPGTFNGIGTFISMDASLQDVTPACTSGSWPKGTTEDWTKNGSMAVLDLPAGAIVKHAELIWAASYRYSTDSVADHIEDSVKFIAEDKSKSMMVPAASSKIINYNGGFSAYYYLNHSDVTAFINDNGGGKYSVNALPGVQKEGTSGVNGGGWTLAVVYSLSGNDTLPTRNITLYIGDRFVEENAVANYSMNNFCAPDSGRVTGKIFVSALEGDATSSDSYIGDALILAKTESSDGSVLSGPNNAKNNFFASQINKSDGTLDTRGSFGNVNHKVNMSNGQATLVSGARQGWDITTLPLKDGDIENKQTSAVVRVSTGKDSLVPTLVGFQIDVNAPNFEGSVISLSNNEPLPGDGFNATLHLTNENGNADAVDTAVSFYLTKEINVMTSGVSCVPAVDVDPSLKKCSVDGGTIALGGTKDLTLNLELPEDGINDDNKGVFNIYADVNYNYSSCTGGASLHGRFFSDIDMNVDWKIPYLDADITSKTLENGQIEYTVTITNKGESSVNGLTVDLDFDSTKAGYVAGTTEIDGVNQNDNSKNSMFYDESKVNDGTLNPGESVTISFVLNADELPVDYVVTATADPDGTSGKNPGITASIETSLSSCGDGKLGNNEECDDHNTKDGDGCSSTCKVETGYVCVHVDDCEYCDVDTDGDELPDNYEEVIGTDPTKPDTDGDGVKDGIEVFGSTDPLNADTDEDGLCDGSQTVDDVCNGGEDKNNNGIVDEGETDPAKADTDGDGLKDGIEILGHTDPTKADTDGDGLCDGSETVGNCKGGEDKNNNGIVDEGETDPTQSDTDGDGIMDGIEVFGDNPTDPTKTDTDGDGLCDGSLEVDGVCKSGEDKNNNGRVDANETNPNRRDTDGDGLSDGIEIYGDNPTNPLNADTDGDGLCDGSVAVGKCVGGEDRNDNGRRDDDETDPNNADTDRGGVPDGQEVKQGTNPLRACDDTDSCTDDGGNGDGDGDGNGSYGDINHAGAYADDCACQSVMDKTTSRFPLLASIFAIFGGALLGFRRRRDRV